MISNISNSHDNLNSLHFINLPFFGLSIVISLWSQQTPKYPSPKSTMLTFTSSSFKGNEKNMSIHSQFLAHSCHLNLIFWPTFNSIISTHAPHSKITYGMKTFHSFFSVHGLHFSCTKHFITPPIFSFLSRTLSLITMPFIHRVVD